MNTESLAYLVTAILGFFPGTYLMEWLKNQFNLADKGAFLSITALSLVLGGLGAWGSGLVDPTSAVTLEGVMELSTIWFTASQVFYRLFMKK